jgi:hypothetical protein
MASNWACTPGPTPGSDSAVAQRKAVAGGMTLPASKRRVTVQLDGSSTGKTMVPGLSGKRR